MAGGRPKKEAEYKRNRALLLRMRGNEYEVITKSFLKAKKNFEADSLTDFIIKSAMGKIKNNF